MQTFRSLSSSAFLDISKQLWTSNSPQHFESKLQMSLFVQYLPTKDPIHTEIFYKYLPNLLKDLLIFRHLFTVSLLYHQN